MPRPRSTNLPPEATSFVGRESDLARLAEMLGAGVRLVTVLGPAGAGKTRLARRFAAQSLGVYAGAGGVWFCDLCEARSRQALVAAVGTSLEVATAAGDPGQQIGHALAGRGPVLVVLDNFEQLVPWAAETVGAWVRRAPDLRLLVTSRERLQIESEACFDLEPLSLELSSTLFEQRARAVRADFTVSRANATDVAELVRRLDGLPLAIELAAARVNVLPPSRLRDRLAARFDLLRSQRQDLPPRQLTLRGAIDWSWELLSEDERETLAQCSVFRGGFSLEAAEAVLAPASGAIVVDLVEALVGKSLVRRYEPEALPGELRFGLYETIRDYAAERLEARGAKDAIEARHSTYYVAEGEQLAEGLSGPDVVRCLARLRLETDNLLAVQRRSGERDPETSVRAALALDGLLGTRGPIDTQMSVLDAAEIASRRTDDTLVARVLLARSQVRFARGDTAAATRDLDEATGAATRAGDRSLVAQVLALQARQQIAAGRFEEARDALSRALATAREAGDERSEAVARAGLARLHLNEHRLDEGRADYDKVVEAARRLGDRVMECSALSRLGIIHQWQGRTELAAESYERALVLAQLLGDRREEYIVRNNLGLWHGDAGRLDQARQQLEAAAALQRAAGHREYVAMAVGALGTIEHAWGDLGEARRLYDESLGLLRELGDRRNEFGALRYFGVLLLEEGHLEEAAERLEEAVAIARDVGDLVGFAAAPLGAARAALDQLEAAEAAFVSAAESLGARADKRQIAVASLYEGMLDVARARAAKAAGADPAAHLERARARLAAEGPSAAAERVLDGRIARRLLEGALAQLESGDEPALPATVPTVEVGPDGQWFAGPSRRRVDLTRRRALRLLLLRLVEQRRAAPGGGVSTDDLIDAGWPGERFHPEAAASRVYTSIKTLRALGLGSLLIRHDDGYLIDPEAAVVHRPR